jgi:hypothetical protein
LRQKIAASASSVITPQLFRTGCACPTRDSEHQIAPPLTTKHSISWPCDSVPSTIMTDPAPTVAGRDEPGCPRTAPAKTPTDAISATKTRIVRTLTGRYAAEKHFFNAYGPREVLNTVEAVQTNAEEARHAGI